MRAATGEGMLDYTKPPPDYRVERFGQVGTFLFTDCLSWHGRDGITAGLPLNWCLGWLTTEHAIIAAWKWYRAVTDPPGLVSSGVDTLGGAGLVRRDGRIVRRVRGYWPVIAARRAAWEIYDRSCQ